MSSTCKRCGELERKIDQLTRELAEARERADALFIGYPPQAPERPVEPAPERPVRYELVDSLNEVVSRLPGYELARRAAEKITKR
jgi:hypothetical protein